MTLRTDWVWRQPSQDDRQARVAELDGNPLPYSVCLVGGRFEAWHRGPALRGSGFWGGEQLGFFGDEQSAMQACVTHWMVTQARG